MNDPRIQELRRLLPQAMLPDWVRIGLRANRLFRDQLHPDKHEAVLTRLFEQVHASIALREHRRLNVPLVSYPPELPITARKDEIVAALRAHQVVVVAGETGSGKTTQLPKMCLEAGLGIAAKIGCTQPRRVAALSISRRIAEELNVEWGRQVGCKIRFDDRSSAETYIKLMTDGILLAEAQGDPQLSGYDAIIIDEAHERSLNIDFLLGHLKGLLARRRDLKLIVTSATIDTQAFSRHFNDAPIIEVSGRLYPVEVVYRPLDAESEERGDVSYVDAAVSATEQVIYETSFGDVLIFMPTERDIREAGDQLGGRLAGDAEIIPLFGRLSAGDQQRVFAPCERRKIVVATNIAETSLTIPGIRFVIDAGLARISRYNPRTRTRRLPVEPVSQSSANQRKGRAGRVQDGTCIRLFPEEDFNARPAFTQPEIQRANLAEVILRMKAFRLGDMETFPFIQPPTPAAIANGYALLQELGALDAARELTPLGRDLARLPIDPTLGRMLLQSQREHATRELLIIASGLSIQDPRERPLDQKDAAAAAHKRFADPQSDFLTLLNIWNAVHDQWETLRTQGQRRKFCRQHFLSYVRMREWQDLYAQLQDALGDLPLHEPPPLGVPASAGPAGSVGRSRNRLKPGHQTGCNPSGSGVQSAKHGSAKDLPEPTRPQPPRGGEPGQTRPQTGSPPGRGQGWVHVSNPRPILEFETHPESAPRNADFSRQQPGGVLPTLPTKVGVPVQGGKAQDSIWGKSHSQSLSPSDGAREGSGSRNSLTESNAAYDAIHRSVLAGLIGHVARRDERNTYKGSGNRELTVFPGSALFERGEKPGKGRDAKPIKNAPPKPKSNQPQWIVAGEIVETSQLFARTIAGIDPQWIYQLAPHCCRVTHQNPHWSVGGGRVLIEEIITLHGLEVQRRKVAYGNLNPKEATAIFIRSALVEENVMPGGSRREEAPSGKRKAESWKAEITERLLASSPAMTSEERELPSQYTFLKRNRAVRQKIEDLQTRARHHGLIDLDQAFFDFYSKRIDNVSSLDELNRFLRDRAAAGVLPAVEPGILPAGKTLASAVALEESGASIAAGTNPGGKMPTATSGRRPDVIADSQGFLCASEADLLGELKLNYDTAAFPDAVKLAEQPLPLRYAYAPGEEWDGVTVQLPVDLARSLPAAAIEWAVPGLRAEQVGELLRSLPKALRRELQPIEPKVIEIVRELQPTGDSLSADLGRLILRRYGITIPADAWRAESVPAHLRPRVEVVDGNRKPIAAGRSLEQLQSQLKDVKAAPDAANSDWRRAAAKWERTAITGWTFGDLPGRITVSGENSAAGQAFQPAGAGDFPVASSSAGNTGLESPVDRQAGKPALQASDATPVYAWPGLVLEDQHVSLRLFRSRNLAQAASLLGVGRLIELAIQKDLGWMQKDLRVLSQLKDLYAPIGSHDELLESAFAHLKRHALPAEPLPALTQAAFDAAVMQARERLRGLPSQLAARLTTILQLRQQVVARLGATAGPGAGRARTLTDLSQLGQAAAPRARHPLAGELDVLLPAQFLEQIGFERLTELPRYLKALLTRIERAALNPVKDQERARQLAPYQDAVNRLRHTPPKSAEGRRQVTEFRWLVEEFKVSLFAQELGTVVPVSAKRLDQQLEQLKLIC